MSLPDALVADAADLAPSRRSAEGPVPRTAVLGLAGGPGSGKSTFAAALAAAVTASGVEAVALPMDGFHLSNAELERRHLADRKGSPETFDSEGLAAILDAIRQPRGAAVWAPAYSRELHEPVRSAIEVGPRVGLVIVEGNWLGLDAGEWLGVRARLDALWFLDVPWEVCRERLVARRVATGREEVAARAWVDSVDAENYWLAQNSSRLADRLITL